MHTPTRAPVCPPPPPPRTPSHPQMDSRRTGRETAYRGGHAGDGQTRTGPGFWKAMRFLALSNGMVMSEYNKPEVIAAAKTLESDGARIGQRDVGFLAFCRRRRG